MIRTDELTDGLGPGRPVHGVVVEVGLPAGIAAERQHPVVLDPELAGHRPLPVGHGGHDPPAHAPQGHRPLQSGSSWRPAVRRVSIR